MFTDQDRADEFMSLFVRTVHPFSVFPVFASGDSAATLAVIKSMFVTRVVHGDVPSYVFTVSVCDVLERGMTVSTRTVDAALRRYGHGGLLSQRRESRAAMLASAGRGSR